MIILFIITIAVIVFMLLYTFKIPRIGQMVLITGGIKTGKTTLSVRVAYKAHKRNLRRWKIKRFIGKIIKKKLVHDNPPLLYSNIPLKCEYSPLTNEIIERKHRPEYGSVVYICETSLVADSMSYKDELLNEQILLFVKLFAHETCNNGGGGVLVLDTQSVSDNHYGIRRCLNTYLHIYKTTNIFFLPFLIVHYEELFFSEDGSRVNVRTEDVTDNLHWCVIPKSTWRLFDRYCYSCFTDHLPVDNKVHKKAKKRDMKARKIITFKKYKTLDEEVYKREI